MGAEAWIEFIALFIGYPFVTKDFIAPKYIIEYPSSINKMIGFAMTYSILIIELTRLYLMAFDLHFLYHSQNQKWQRSIDISFADDNRNWFLKNKKKYGNKQKVTKAMIAYILLSIVLVSISYVIVSENVSRFIAICLISICPLISLLICFKIRKYANLNDNMLFFFELKATAIIWILCFFLNALMAILEKKSNGKVDGTYLDIFSFVFATLAPSLLSTVYIPYKIRLDPLWKKLAKKKQAKNATMAELEEGGRVSGEFWDMMKNEIEFERFMNWMYREFSHESALSFVEIIQFKKYCIEHLEGEDNIITSSSTILERMRADNTKFIDLSYESVPKSSIVFRARPDMTESEKCKEMARELYLKYINYNQAEFKLNITVQMRERYRNIDYIYWNIPRNDLIQVFDRVLFIMHNYMNQSFARYYDAANRAN